MKSAGSKISLIKSRSTAALVSGDERNVILKLINEHKNIAPDLDLALKELQTDLDFAATNTTDKVINYFENGTE